MHEAHAIREKSNGHKKREEKLGMKNQGLT